MTVNITETTELYDIGTIHIILCDSERSLKNLNNYV